MAKIPTAADLPQIAPVRTPTIRIPDAAMGGIGEGLQEAGNALFSYGVTKMKEEDDTQAQDLVNRLSKTRRELLEGTDKQEGYKTLTGKTALDRRKEYEERFAQERDRLLAEAPNDRVRRRVQAQFGAQTEQFLSNVAGHRNGQEIAYEDKVFATTLTEAQQSAVGAADEKTRQGYIRDIYNKTYEHTKKRTGDKDIAESAAKAARTKAHSAVVEDMLLKPDGAKLADAYLKANRTNIDTDQYGKLVEAVKKGSLLETGQAEAETAASKYDLYDPKQAQQALADVRAKYKGKPEQLKAAEDAVYSRIKEVSVFKGLEEDKSREGAIAKLSKDPTASLTVAEEAALLKTTGGQAYIDRMRRGDVTPSDTVERKAMVEYEQLVEDVKLGKRELPTAAEFAVQFDGRFRQGNFEARLVEIRKIGDALNEAPDELSTEQQELTTATNELGLGGSKNEEKRGAFMRRVREAWDIERQRKGGSLMDTERRTILRQMMREQIQYDTTFTPDTVMPALITDSQKTEMADEVIGIEKKEHREIFSLYFDDMVAALRKSRVPVTTEAIRTMWETNKSKFGVK